MTEHAHGHQLPNGEAAEQVEDLEMTEVRDRLDRHPEEQRNREDSPHAGHGDEPPRAPMAGPGQMGG